jgi:hypothetical protein
MRLEQRRVWNRINAIVEDTTQLVEVCVAGGMTLEEGRALLRTIQGQLELAVNAMLLGAVYDGKTVD